MKNNSQIIHPFASAQGEKDTYQPLARQEKEKITTDKIRTHWETRSRRPGIQSVVSSRYRLEENERAYELYKKAVLHFLDGLIEGKNVFELGVGVGDITAEIAKKAKHVTGIDFSEGMVKRARERLKDFDNVDLIHGTIEDVSFVPKSFDLVCEMIVLLHVLNPTKLSKTIDRMMDLSNTIFIAEHTYQGNDFPSSKYTILRSVKEYAELFNPYKLVRQTQHYRLNDKLTLMLFINPKN